MVPTFGSLIRTLDIEHFLSNPKQYFFFKGFFFMHLIPHYFPPLKVISNILIRNCSLEFCYCNIRKKVTKNFLGVIKKIAISLNISWIIARF